MKYDLSIIIPTKNRQKYCLKAVEEITNFNWKNVQIVIQDNSDDSTLKKELKEYKNIKYNYHKGVLSFVDNFSEAVEIADGEYLCMIGDDDGVLPNILDHVYYMKKNNYDALIPGLNSVYFWPSTNSVIKNGEKGYLCIANVKNRIYDIDCKNGLIDLMKKGCQDYQTLDIPRLYHGIVKHQNVDLVKKKVGKYFDGLTPDIYMATALCFTCKKVCKIDYPVTISGICPKSGSSDSATGKHTGNLKDAPHFNGHENYQWDIKVPKIYSVESIWADTALHAIKDFDGKSYYDKFRVDILDAICLSKYPQFKNEIKNHSKNFSNPILYISIIGKYLKILNFLKRAIKRVIRKRGSVLKYYNIENINEACDITVRELEKCQIKL